MSGQTILDELEFGARTAPGKNAGLLHAAGLTYTIDSRIPTPVKVDKNNMLESIEGERRVKDVKVKGEAIAPEKIYNVVSTNYVFFEKGNGHVFSGAKLIEADFATDAEILGCYIRKLEIIPEAYGNTKGQGRLKIIK